MYKSAKKVHYAETGPDRRAKKAPAQIGRRDRRKLATREALLNAANALLHSRSMDALSVDEIVEGADVARGTFYNYFPDKDALERALASRTRARIENEIARLNVGVREPVQRIARAFCSVLRLGISAQQEATAMMRLFPRATDPAAPINSGVRRDAAEGMAQGRIVAASEDVVVAYVMGVFVTGVNRALDLPPERVREFAQGLGTVLIHGLGIKRVEAERIARDAVQSILA
ncbi:MAG TPA: helix-turn-helix domain-containing protein [Candidatus Binataceae bacterium]